MTPVAEVFEDRTLLSTLTVNSLDDNTDPDAFLTLREAILLVNNGGDADAAFGGPLTPGEQAQIDNTQPFGTNDRIQFDPGLMGGVIQLNGNALLISRNVIVNGLGQTNLGIDGADLSQIFVINNANTQISVTISGLFLFGGFGTSGGAISSTENLTISNSTIAFNAALFGGGIENDGGTLTVISSFISDNIADVNAGGIQNSGGMLSLTNSTLSNNSAAANGGGIANIGGSVTITGGTIIGNTALNGGGIFNDATLSLSNAEVSFNSADEAGGGIANIGGTTTISSSDFLTNEAVVSGGAIENQGGQVSIMAQSLIQGNFAFAEGGGINSAGALASLQVNNSTFSLNGVFGNGGGINNTDGTATISNSSFMDNFAFQGGAVSTNNGATTIDDSDFSGNFADLGGAINNGDDFFAGGSTTTITDSEFLENTATSEGGAIRNLNGLINLSGSMLRNNSAGLFGGGIENIGSLFFDPFSSDPIDPGLMDLGRLIISETTFQENTADSFGGGIDNFLGFAEITDSDFLSNRSFGDGGGISNFAAIMSISSSMVSGNRATGFSGGIDNFFSQLTVDTSLISNNTAGTDGGGIANTDAVLTLNGTSITNNSATRDGGGIENFGGSASLNHVLLIQNTARRNGGGIDSFDAMLTVTDSLLLNNSAAVVGGGVFSNFEATIQGTGFDGNQANSGAGIFNDGTLTLTRSALIRNSAEFDGGGIQNNARLTVGETTITENTAGFNGGGIQNNDLLILHDSTLSVNRANDDGGGIFNSGESRISNSTLSQNVANDNGGGIYNLNGLTRLQNVTLFGNRADADGDAAGTGGGLWTLNTPSAVSLLFNTIVAGNVRGAAFIPNDIASKNVDPVSTNNLIGDPNSAGGLVDDPEDLNGDAIQNIVGDRLGNLLNINTVLDTTLRPNGGPTHTHALLPRSPAVNAGREDLSLDGITRPTGPGAFIPIQDPPNNKRERDTGGKTVPNQNMMNNATMMANPPVVQGSSLEIPEFDQRGPDFFRITSGQIDIGAVELQIKPDLAIGSGGLIEGEVIVFDAVLDRRVFQFHPYENFTGGVRVALGDVTGDGFNDIITAPGPGGGPHIRIFDGRLGGEIESGIASFMAYQPMFLGGVFVAAADLNHDGKAEIITGAGEGGGPHVRVFDLANGATLFDFFAYNPLFVGGVRVAAGDINGDGTADIITGAGPGGGPHVQVFSGQNLDSIASFFAFPPTYTGGVFVASNNTGIPNDPLILVGSGRRDIGTTVAVFQNGTINNFQVPLNGGVTVATFDLNRDGENDFITGGGPGGNAEVILLSGKPNAANLPFGPQLTVTALLAFPFGELYRGGLFVAGSSFREPLPAALRASEVAPPHENSVSNVTLAELIQTAEAAVERFALAGLSRDQLELLQSVEFHVADLDGDLLGVTDANTITIDLNAAGFGFFVDATPGDDREFDTSSGQALIAAAMGKFDLLTVISHELGHLLGLGHVEEPSHLMAEQLGLGVRRTIQPEDLAELDLAFQLGMLEHLD